MRNEFLGLLDARALTRLGALSLTALALACGDSSVDTDGGTAASVTDPSAGPGTSGSLTDAQTSGQTSEQTSGPTSGQTGGSTTTTDPGTGSTDPGTTTSETTDTPGTTTSATTDGPGTTGEPVCPQGEIICEDGVELVCDGMGGFESQNDCDSECADGLGCVLCIPGEGTCDGDSLTLCNDQGDGFEETTCDGLQGLSCDPDAGACVGACAPQVLGLNYIGCDYYATVLPQHDSYNGGQHQYAITVSNTTGDPAEVTVTRGANTVTTDTVAPDSVKVINLPWLNDTTKTTGPSKVVTDGSYRVRSTRPVTVYQYNPLSATTTNDASILLPVNAWTPNYLVAAWKQWSGYPGFYTVVAREDGTTVNVTPSATGSQVQAGGGIAANGTGAAMLNEGDALIVYSSNGDLTGTLVNADKPVEVFGGHKCTQVPPGACDHLEDNMFPIETLAKDYIVAPTAQYPNINLKKPHVVKVIATEADTELVFEPDQGVNTTLANAGDFVEINNTTNDFRVSSEKKIMVALYMVGQSGNTGESDPAMVIVAPTEQFRTDYLVHASTTWLSNYVDIIAPDGASVEVDGAAVNSFTPLNAPGYSIAHVPLSNNGDGNHTITANQKVGISVYGVQSYGSYWYPGGLDLNLIPQ